MPVLNAMMFSFLTGTVTPAQSFLDAVSSTLTSVIEWFGTIITALVATDGALSVLFPFVAIAFALGLVYGGIRLVRTFVPGF